MKLNIKKLIGGGTKSSIKSSACILFMERREDCLIFSSSLERDDWL